MALSRSAISSFHAKGLASIADALGTQVTISGKTFFAHVSTPRPSTSLEDGGSITHLSITLRWPVGRAPKPAKGTVVHLVSENRSFKVDTSVSLQGSPFGNEIHVIAITSAH